MTRYDDWAGQREAPPPGEDEVLLPSTWLTVDLGPALDGDEEEQPVLGARTDGAGLFYAGRVHWLMGEAESLKTWAALVAIVQVLADGGNVLFIDYEDTARGVANRLRSLGVDVGVLRNPDRFRYVRPNEPLMGSRGAFTRHMAELERHLEDDWTMIVLDGVTESMTVEGLDLIDNTDVATWLALLPRRMATRTCAAVVCIDHVTKDVNGNGRYAIGGQHKLAGLDGAAYRFTTVRKLRRALVEPENGRAKLTVSKDRPGWIRARTQGDAETYAVLDITAYPDGGISARLVPPGEIEELPDADLIAAVLEHLSVYDGASMTNVEESVSGKATAVRDALRWLSARQWIDVRKEGVAHRHYLTDLGRQEMKA